MNEGIFYLNLDEVAREAVEIGRSLSTRNLDRNDDPAAQAEVDAVHEQWRKERQDAIRRRMRKGDPR